MYLLTSCYLHEDAGKTYQISNKRSYWKYSKVTICKHAYEKEYWRLEEYCKNRVKVKGGIPRSTIQSAEFCKRLT